MIDNYLKFIWTDYTDSSQYAIIFYSFSIFLLNNNPLLLFVRYKVNLLLKLFEFNAYTLYVLFIPIVYYYAFRPYNIRQVPCQRNSGKMLVEKPPPGCLEGERKQLGI